MFLRDYKIYDANLHPLRPKQPVIPTICDIRLEDYHLELRRKATRDKLFETLTGEQDNGQEAY